MSTVISTPATQRHREQEARRRLARARADRKAARFSGDPFRELYAIEKAAWLDRQAAREAEARERLREADERAGGAR